jgi:DNA-binding beta-propeller fold protein YncE
LLAVLVLAAPALLAGTPEFRFDRQWPALQQPWYFIDPGCVAVDDAGSVYVADTRNNLVRKFSRDGTLITQWGGRNSGDASLNQPQCVVLGPDNNVYVSDEFRVRVFDTDGRFIRLLGGGGSCPGKFIIPGEMAFDSLQRLYVLDGNNERLQRFEDLGQCTASIPGYVAGGFDDPPCVIQQPNSCVLVWDGSTTSGQPAFDRPAGLAIDSQDQVVIAEAGGDQVRKFTADGTFIQSLGGPGTGPGEFNSPVSVSINQNDQVYIAEFDNNRIQEFDIDGNFVQIINGAQQETDNTFFFPESITATSDGELYVTDNSGFRVMRFDANWVLTADWASGSREQGRLTFPAGIDAAIDTTDGLMPERLFVADENNDRINVYELDGRLVRSFGETTGVGGDFNAPGALAVSGGLLYVTNRFSFVDTFDLNGNFISSWPGSNPLDPDNPFGQNCIGKFGSDFGRGLAVDPSGDNIYVSDGGNPFATVPTSARVLKFNAAGTCLLEIGVGVLDRPKGVAVDSNGRLLVVDTDRNNAVARVVVFDATTGTELAGQQFGAPCPGSICAAGEFVTPYGIDVDLNNNIYVTEAAVVNNPATITRHIQAFDSDGTFLTGFSDTGAGPGQSFRSKDVTVSSSGDVYFTDASLSRIEKFASTPLNLNTRAIVLAGGGPFPGNVLWPATQSNANFAFRTLATQGLGKSTIQYLSADTGLDMDQNGQSDEVDADATNANLELAILGPGGTGSDGFAGNPGIDHLVIYLIDHGGLDAFRMSGSELIYTDLRCVPVGLLRGRTGCARTYHHHQRPGDGKRLFRIPGHAIVFQFLLVADF